MELTYERAVVSAAWDDPRCPTPVDEDGWIYHWLNLTSSGDDDPATVLPLLINRLNERRLDWSDLAEEGSRAELSIPLSGHELLGTCNAEVAPVEYLNAFCELLTQRGWQGQLTRHLQSDPPWRTLTADSTITTMLGYGLIPDPDFPNGSLDIWFDEPHLFEEVVEIALDWVDHGPGPLWYQSVISWNPTRKQAKDLLIARHPLSNGVAELGRLELSPKDPSTNTDLDKQQFTGRTAVIRAGHLMLTERDADRTLTSRLVDHHDVLAQRSKSARYGLTTGTVGYAPHSTVYGIRGEDLPSGHWMPPRQRPHHTPGLPDAYYSQLIERSRFTSGELAISEWRRDDLPGGHTLITARDPQKWFTTKPDPHGRQGRLAHGPTQDTLGAARRSLGDLLQRPLK